MKRIIRTGEDETTTADAVGDRRARSYSGMSDSEGRDRKRSPEASNPLGDATIKIRAFGQCLYENIAFGPSGKALGLKPPNFFRREPTVPL